MVLLFVDIIMLIALMVVKTINKDVTVIVCGASMVADAVSAIIAIVFMVNKKYSKATKWAFGMLLMVAIALAIGSFMAFSFDFPGSGSH